MKQMLAFAFLFIGTQSLLSQDSLYKYGWLPRNGSYGFLEAHREFGKVGYSNDLVRRTYKADASILGNVVIYRSEYFEFWVFTRLQIVMGESRQERLTIPVLSGIFDLSCSYRLNEWLSLIGGSYHQSTHPNEREIVIKSPGDVLALKEVKLLIEDLNLYYFGVRLDFALNNLDGSFRTGLQPIKPVYYMVAREDRVLNSSSYPHYDRMYFYQSFLAWEFIPGNRAVLEIQGEQGSLGRFLIEFRYSTKLEVNPSMDRLQLGISLNDGMGDNEIVVTRYRGIAKRWLTTFIRVSF